MTALASATAYIGEKGRAEEMFRQAVKTHPASASAFGLWLQQEGRFEESIQCFMSSLAAEPNQGTAYYGLAEAKAFEIDGESWIEAAEPLVDSDDLDLKGRTYLCYALARAYEKRQDTAKAIRYFDRANQNAYLLYNEGRPFNRKQLSELTDQIISTFSADIVSKPLDSASDSDCPIFIVGMIRSGTTLLDQILSRHPMVKSAGEPVFWMRESDRIRRMPPPEANQVEEIVDRYLKAIEAVAGNSPRISDKMPLNYPHIGLIHRIFPKAKIIHLRRNPLDTCFSIYTTYLGRGPGFAYNQSNIVFNYLQYLTLMEHWRNALPASHFIELDYEALVDSPEPEIRRILEFCNLEWDEACISQGESDSSIRTPSKWQARQPVYKSSIHRWKPYENRLGELIALKVRRHPDLERF